MIVNTPFGSLDSIQLIGLILFFLLVLQSLLGIGLGIGFLLQPPLYRTVIDLNAAFNRQAYFSIYAPHILLIIASGIVILSVFFGFLGIVRRRWRYLIVAMICLVLYMSILSGSCASGFAYYDRLRPTLESDVARTTAPIWSSIRSTYSCVGTNCVNVLETAMYNNKIRIGIISAVFLLVPSLILIVLMFQMRRDILYFK